MEAKKGSTSRFAAGTLFFLGLVLMAVAGFAVYRRIAFLDRAVRAEGRVIELVPRSGSKGKTLFAPRVEFRDEKGMMASLVGSVASGPPAYEEGESVRIVYVAGREAEGDIDSFANHWFMPLFLGVFGTIVVGMGAVGLWIAPRLQPTTRTR